MSKILHQTRQAFLFSLSFYLLALSLMVLGVSFAPILVSIALLLSLIWLFLVLKEIILSNFIDSSEKIILVLFLIFLNILAGIVYFFFIRDKVLGVKRIKK